MNIESIREYCLSLPMTSEDMAFGEDCLLLRVCGKIFACCMLTGADYLTVKCDAGYAVELREEHPEIEPAWHWNKKYWNQLRLDGALGDEFIKSLIRHSYAEVTSKLPRSIKTEHPEILSIE